MQKSFLNVLYRPGEYCIFSKLYLKLGSLYIKLLKTTCYKKKYIAISVTVCTRTVVTVLSIQPVRPYFLRLYSR